MKRWLLAALALLVACSVAFGVARLRPIASTEPVRGPRLVSLAPAVTETLRALGAGRELVAVSDYCPEPGALPRVGSAITPNYEAIARARPTRIVTTEVAGSQLDPLARIAPTLSLPWLSVPDVAASVRKLGEVTGQASSARALAERFEKTLAVAPPAGAPRVLLLLGDAGTSANSYWFLKADSLHGALLHAAGGRNAVARAVSGAPRLAVEELLTLNPDIIVVFSADARGQSAVASFFTELRKLTPLRAVKSGRLGSLVSPRLLGSGPSLLNFVEPLRVELARLSALPTP